MTGSIDGQTVTWQDINEAFKDRGDKADAAFTEYQHAAWSGPGSQVVKAAFSVPGGATAPATAGRLNAYLRTVPHVLAYEPTGMLFDLQYAWLRRTNGPWRRFSSWADSKASWKILGTLESHSLGLRTTSRHRTNTWGLPGLTAIHVPGGASPVGEVVDDAARNVIRTPTEFATHDGTYVADQRTRNNVPIEAPMGAGYPDDFLTVTGDAVQRAGTGWAAEDVDVVHKTGTVNLRGANDDLLFEHDTEADLEIDIQPYATVRPAFARSGLPVRPQEVRLDLDNGWSIDIQDNGNTWIYPVQGDTFQVQGAVTTRALASGVFYHEVQAGRFLVATEDFAVDGSGNVTWSAADQVFGIVQYDPLAGDLVARLQEVLAETMTEWQLVRRTQ